MTETKTTNSKPDSEIAPSPAGKARAEVISQVSEGEGNCRWHSEREAVFLLRSDEWVVDCLACEPCAQDLIREV